MATCQIDIQGNLLSLRKRHNFCVSRSLPAALAPYLSGKDWMAFCDRLDQALEPINKLKRKISRMVCCVTIPLFLSPFVGVIVAMNKGDWETAPNEEHGGKPEFVGPAPNYVKILAMIAALAVVVNIGMALLLIRADGKARKRIRAVCQEVSGSHTFLAFSSRNGEGAIQVQISDVEGVVASLY